MAAPNSRIVGIAAFLLGAACGGLGLAAVHHIPAGVAHAQQVQQAPASGGCNLASLDGAYGVIASGERLVASDGTPLAMPVPIDFIGAGTFDGAGHFSGTDTVDNDGAIVQGSGTGTYAVNANCTFTLTDMLTTSNGQGVPLHLAGVLVDGGKRGYLIGTDQGRNNIQATLERQ